MSEITQNRTVTNNQYYYVPLVRFQYRNGHDEIVTVETHVKEISRDSHYIHGYADAKSYPRERIIGTIDLLEFNLYVAEMKKLSAIENVLYEYKASNTPIDEFIASTVKERIDSGYTTLEIKGLKL